MKPSFSIFTILLSGLLWIPGALAQSPREQLNQLAGQLRANPGDQTLRELIIKLSLEIKPAPAMPEEAERRLGRGQAAFETAKEPADFEKAIAEFNAASLAAPWLPAPYYNLAIAQEKAKKYREAMASFRLYLLASPGAADASEVRQRIFKLEYLAEQPPPAPSDEQLLARVNGARFMLTGQPVMTDSRGDRVYEVQGKSLLWGGVIRQAGSFDRQYNSHAFQLQLSPITDYVYKGGLRWEKPREQSCPDMFSSWSTCAAAVLEVSPDGRTLTGRWFNFSKRAPDSDVYYRAN